MVPPPKNAAQLARYARLVGISMLLLVILGLSFPGAAHTAQRAAQATSQVGAHDSPTDTALRLPGRLSYQSEHSVCAA